MLKVYRMPNGRTYQFEESEAPQSAVEVKAKKPEDKAKKPEQNKARKAAAK